MKALKAAVLIAVVLGVIGAGAASLWLGRGVKLALERYGPGILGAPVTVDAVVLMPWSGRGAVRNLVVGNPPGFKGAHALKVGAVDVKIRLSSLTRDLIVVESVVVRDPEIRYEAASGGSNVARLQRNAESAAGKPASAPASAGAPAGSGKSLLIKDLVVSGGKVGLAATALGGQAVTLPLPSVHLTDIGGKGRSPAAATAEVFRAITGSVSKALAELATKRVAPAAAAALNKLGGLLKRK